MAIQIGTLRTWTQKDGTQSKPFFKAVKGFNYESLKDLFDNIGSDLDKHLGKNEQYNLFYTVGHHLQGQRLKTSWQCQDIIPFDLDGIDLDKIHLYPPVVAKACGFDLSKTAIIHSGNGVHILVQVPRFGEDDKEYIKDKRLGYKQLYERIMAACKDAKLPITKDTTAWDYARILRCPYTTNKKTKDGIEITKNCTIFQSKLVEQDWAIPQVEKLDKGLSISVGSFPIPDTKEVLNECLFFKWLKDSPEEVHEPHAYAWLSIAGHFNDEAKTARALYDTFSSPSISSKPFAEFLEQAMQTSGPRTCKGIDDIWGKCNTCPHYQKITSPILLKSDDWIGTEFQGFSLHAYTSTGKKIIKRCYEDLRKYYARETRYIHITDRKSIIMEFDGKIFKEVSEAHIKALSQEKFRPLVEDDKIRTQFLNQVKSAPDRIRKEDFLRAYQENLVNLNNGVLDLKEKKLLEHSPKYGFTKVLDYDYDKKAICPNWDKFIDAAMMQDKDLINLVEEMMVFALSGMSYVKFQYYFLFIGKGFNGKSTLLGLLEELLGEGNYTAHPLEDLIEKQDARASLAYSLANIVSDSSATAIKGKDLTRMKAWTGNDTVTGRFLYQDGFSFINRAKFIFGFNDMPEIKTTSKGDERRIKAIPFKADFSGDQSDFFIADLASKLKNERSGILNKLVIAHKRLLKKGFTKTKALDMTKDTIRKNADSVYDFFSNKVHYSEGDKVSFNDLLDNYNNDHDYGAENYPKQQRSFNKEIRGIIATLPNAKNIKESVYKFDGVNKRGLLNLTLGADGAQGVKF